MSTKAHYLFPRGTRSARTFAQINRTRPIWEELVISLIGYTGQQILPPRANSSTSAAVADRLAAGQQTNQPTQFCPE